MNGFRYSSDDTVKELEFAYMIRSTDEFQGKAFGEWMNLHANVLVTVADESDGKWVNIIIYGGK